MSGNSSTDMAALTFRTEPGLTDASAVRAIVESTGFFSADEADVAVELVDERLARGEASGYYFVFADDAKGAVGYACFGPIPCTRASWDLYWIVVHNELRGRGLGRQLMERAEDAIRAMGGTRIYVDTSSREQYAPTRGFYEACGYGVDVVQEDFYAPGDSKVIFLKKL